MKTINSWLDISQRAKQSNLPVVIMVDQEDCPFCRRVESEFFAAIFANGELTEQAIFGKISIDAGETIVDASGAEISTRSFLIPYETNLTPTILFLNSEKKELSEKMIGLMTPDFYGFYLEQSIKKAIAALG